MLSLSLVALGLAAIGACAKPTVHAPGALDVSLSTPSNRVASASDLRIVATVKNTGDEDLKILKYGTVLDSEHPTRSFTVSKDGKDVPFTGTTVPTPTDQLSLSENDWVVIPAGKNVSVEHKAWAQYDFSASGPGTFTFDPVSRFQVIGLDDSVEGTSDTTRVNIVNGHSVSIAITIATTDVSKRELEKGGLYCADSKLANAIELSVIEAAFLAVYAISYIESLKPGDTLYQDYFGKNPTKTVIDNFRRILTSGGPVAMTCNVDPNEGCSRINSAFPALIVGPDKVFQKKYISYCSSFVPQLSLDAFCTRNTPVYARSLRGGTTLRMMITLVVKDAVDGNYGCSEGSALSDSDKIKNNGNYECFAAQVFKDTKCGR